MMERLRDILTSHWVRRTVLGLYVALLSVTIAGYMGVSWLEIQTAAYIRGSETVETGRPNAVRGGILDVASGNFRSGVDVGLFLLEPVKEGAAGGRATRRPKARAKGEFDGAMLATVHPGRGGLFHNSFQVPESVSPGTYDLALRVQGASMEPFEAFTEVTVAGDGPAEVSWPTKTSRITNEDRREKLSSGPIVSQEGAIAIDVLPHDGELARGLRNRIYLRTYDAETGEPVAARVIFEDVQGMGRWAGRGGEGPEEVKTGTLGLAEITMTPVGGQQWEVRAEPLGDAPAEEGEGEESAAGTGSATLQLHTVATQVSVSLRRPVVGPNRSIRGTVRSLFQSGHLLVDLYRGNDWLAATHLGLRNREAELDLDVPDSKSGEWLYRLQIARGFYDAGANWQSLYVVDPAAIEGEGLRAALDTVAHFVAKNRESDKFFQHVTDNIRAESAAVDSKRRELWLRAFQRAIPRHFSRPDTLFNTEKSDREKLQQWKDGVKSDLMVLIGFGLAGGLAVLLYVVVLGVRRHREHRRELQEVDDELAAEEFGGELEEGELFPDGGTSENLLVALLGCITLATFAMFAAGVMLLLNYM